MVKKKKKKEQTQRARDNLKYLCNICAEKYCRVQIILYSIKYLYENNSLKQ